MSSTLLMHAGFEIFSHVWDHPFAEPTCEIYFSPSTSNMRRANRGWGRICGCREPVIAHLNVNRSLDERTERDARVCGTYVVKALVEGSVLSRPFAFLHSMLLSVALDIAFLAIFCTLLNKSQSEDSDQLFFGHCSGQLLSFRLSRVGP